MDEEDALADETEYTNTNRAKYPSIDYSSFGPLPTLCASLLSLGMTPTMIACIHALKRLQLKTIELDAKFHEKVLKMEEEVQSEHDGIFQERCAIVNGTFNDQSLLEVNQSLGEIREELRNATVSEPTEGIPDFWLTVLKRVPGGLVKEWDEPVLTVS